MNIVKEFIKKKKVDNKFKQLGRGHVLSGESSSPGASGSGFSRHNAQSDAEARARAAAAVEKRLNENTTKMSHSQKAVYMQAKRELEQEKIRLQEENSNQVEEQDKQNADSSVLFTCDLLEGLALPKSEMYAAIETFLRSQMAEEGLDSSILMIYSLNKPVDAKYAIETIQKYIENICLNSEDPKYRKIRKSNKVFLERVCPVKGAEEFLKAIGFCEEVLTSANSDAEHFLVMSEKNVNTDKLQDALLELKNGTLVSLKLFRDPKVFFIDSSKSISPPELSADFYRLSVAEVRNMQEVRSREVERLSTLRTRKMRETDACLSDINMYKYTLIRIRFPNNFMLQGMFNVCESVFAVREFVYNHLDFLEGEFELSVPSTGRLPLNDDKSLMENGLVPSALIHFDWSDNTVSYFNNLQCPPSYLNSALEIKAEKLH